MYPFSYVYQEEAEDDEPLSSTSQSPSTEKRKKVVKKVANDEYLFMVLDGHGEHGALVSEFAMRHVRVYIYTL